MQTKKPLSLIQIFTVPALMALISLAGIILALLVEGPLDILFALASGSGLLGILFIFKNKNTFTE